MNTPRTALEECLRLAPLSPADDFVISDDSGRPGICIRSGLMPVAEMWWTGMSREEMQSLAAFMAAACNLARNHGKALSEALGGWLPIETAPKDGTFVLLGDADYGVVSVGRAVGDHGWYAMNNDPFDTWGGALSVTHWRPLPPPPTSAKGSELNK